MDYAGVCRHFAQGVRRPPKRTAREQAGFAAANAVCRPRGSVRFVSPNLLVRLGNLNVARKPGRDDTVHPDPLSTTNGAADALGLAVGRSDLDELRQLHRAVVELVDCVLDGQEVQQQAARITALAQPSWARVKLETLEGIGLSQRLEWTDPTLVAGLARRVVLELGAIERRRLRRCARAECDLVFYDTTRSNTRRWHAESPCGQRERQRRHRAARGVQREARAG